jgi:ABC-type uncharacterized transport system substrate-binding protein
MNAHGAMEDGESHAMGMRGFAARGRLCSTAAALAAGMFSWLAPQSANAHPHVWVTIETEVLSDEKGLVTGLRHKWTFDEMFSTFASQGLDANGDGQLDRQELAALAEENVSSLKYYDYFTYAKAGEKDVALLDPPKDYFLTYKDQRLTLNFTLPLKEPVSPRAGKISYAVYDPTFYVDFAYPDGEPVKLAANGPAGCHAQVAEKKESTATETALSEAFYQGLSSETEYGRQFARDVVISCDAG